MKLQTLFSRTSTGAVQEWTIEVDGPKYRTIHGQTGGKLQTTEWTVAKGTNEGRANYRDPEAQAIFEAQAAWTKKKDTGYFIDVSKIDHLAFVEPMLAKKYENGLSFPVYSQPKLDGARCLAQPTRMQTRTGKDWVAVPHIAKALEPFFAAYPDVTLDGELYTHTFHDDFNRIMSLVKKSKPTPADLQESAQYVEYWVYDCVMPGQFDARSAFLKKALADVPGIVLVPTTLVHNQKELDDLYGSYLDDGYEGQIVRLNAKYENKRSKFLLKRKEFQDQEYTILDIVEGDGNRTGMAGRIFFKNEEGQSFKSNIKGDRAYLRELLVNKEKYIGKEATVRYFNKTPDNIPRFPYMYGVRDYE